jgi:hypothetical protein
MREKAFLAKLNQLVSLDELEHPPVSTLGVEYEYATH